MARSVEVFYQALGARIRDLRKRRGITQEQLGARLVPHVTRASIANIESGKQRVLAHSVAQLAVALDVTADDLLHERPSPIDHGLTNAVDALQEKLGAKGVQQLKRQLGLASQGKNYETAPDTSSTDSRGESH